MDSMMPEALAIVPATSSPSSSAAPPPSPATSPLPASQDPAGAAAEPAAAAAAGPPRPRAHPVARMLAAELQAGLMPLLDHAAACQTKKFGGVLQLPYGDECVHVFRVKCRKTGRTRSLVRWYRHTKNIQTSLMNAIRCNNVERVVSLIRMGADVNQPDDSGVSPLELAKDLRSMDCMTVLMENGARTVDPASLTMYVPGKNHEEMERLRRGRAQAWDQWQLRRQRDRQRLNQNIGGLLQQIQGLDLGGPPLDRQLGSLSLTSGGQAENPNCEPHGQMALNGENEDSNAAAAEAQGPASSGSGLNFGFMSSPKEGRN